MLVPLAKFPGLLETMWLMPCPSCALALSERNSKARQSRLEALKAMVNTLMKTLLRSVIANSLRPLKERVKMLLAEIGFPLGTQNIFPPGGQH